MKKYFVHSGAEQQGPFTLEDLKQRGINKDTSIWYEGLEKWVAAEKVEELQDLLKSTPPPFNDSKAEPPPFEKAEQTQNHSTQGTGTPYNISVTPVKKSRVGLIITLALLFIIIIAGIVMVVNNPNAIPGVKVKLNIPKPIVATSRADGSKSGVFKARTTVYATVMNQGGDGNVLVTFHVYQDGKDFDRSKSIYLRANESQDLEMTFDEVKMLGGKITYDVAVRAE